VGVAAHRLEAQGGVARAAAGIERRRLPRGVAELFERALQVRVERFQVMRAQEVGLVVVVAGAGPAVAAAVGLGDDLLAIGRRGSHCHGSGACAV